MTARESVPAMTDLASRDSADFVDAFTSGIRGEVAALVYSGPESVQDAATLRERAMAMVDLARRAGVLGLDHLLAARESERGLGQMLVLGREVGDIATNGGDRRSESSATTLNEFGVSRDLAADAVVLASLSDDEWRVLVERARATEAVTRSALVSGARQIVSFREAQGRTHDSAAARAEELAQAAQEAARRLDDLLAQPYVPTQPALQPDELRMDGAGAELRAVISRSAPTTPDASARDDSVEAQRQRALVKVMRDLTDRLEQTPPYLTDDVWTAVNVLSARDNVHRLVDALTGWMRALNLEWKEHTNGN